MTTSELKIYAIPQLIEDAAAKITVDEETGEVIGGIELQELIAASQEKTVSTACYLKNRTAYLAAMKQAKKDLDDRIKAEEKRQQWLNRCLIQAMQTLGLNRLETPEIEVKLAKKPESVEVFDEAQLPAEYIKTKTETSVDKVALKSALKVGDVPGAKLVGGYRLAIR